MAATIEKYDITGMTCAACSAHVEKAVSKLPGVQKVEVSLLTNSMAATHDGSVLQADIIAIENCFSVNS